MLSPTRGRSLETFVPAFRAFQCSLSHAKKSYLMTAITTNPRAWWSCCCLLHMQLFLFLYAGTFTWCVSTAILLKSRLAAAKEPRIPGRAQTGFTLPAAAALRLDAGKHTTHTSTLFPFGSSRFLRRTAPTGSGRGVRSHLAYGPANAPCCDAHVCSQNRFAPQDPSLSFFASNVCRRGPVYGSTPKSTP